jgi:hypothetical protein
VSFSTIKSLKLDSTTPNDAEQRKKLTLASFRRLKKQDEYVISDEPKTPNCNDNAKQNYTTNNKGYKT